MEHQPINDGTTFEHPHAASQLAVRVVYDAAFSPAGVCALTVYTGCSWSQIYARPDKLRALAHLLTRAADAVDAGVAAQSAQVTA